MLIRDSKQVVVGEIIAHTIHKGKYPKLVWDANAIKWGTDEKKFLGTFESIEGEEPIGVLNRATDAIKSHKW